MSESKQYVPPGLGKWSSVSRLCPSCVPDQRNQINLFACYECLQSHLDPIDPSNACELCCQITYEGRCTNRSCGDEQRPFEGVFAIGYRHEQNLLHRLINQLKFNRVRANAISLGALLWGELRNNEHQYRDYARIAPVPRTAADAKEKGDPLSFVFGLGKGFLESTGPSEIANRMVHGLDHFMEKVLQTEKSPGMSLAEKRRVAYSIMRGEDPNPYSISDASQIRGERVLMVDDVFTSGYHTMFAVAHALSQAGASQVDVLVLGRHKWSY